MNLWNKNPESLKIGQQGDNRSTFSGFLTAEGTRKETGMSIGNVSSAGMNPYPCTSSRRKVAGKGNFSADMQKTAKVKETAEKSGLSPWEGDWREESGIPC